MPDTEDLGRSAGQRSFARGLMLGSRGVSSGQNSGGRC